MKKLFTVMSRVLLYCLILAIVSTGTFADEKKEQERFSGIVSSQAGIYEETRKRLNMTVESWTTPEEVVQLYNSIRDKDTDAKLKEIRKLRVGSLWFTGSMRLPINMASSEDTEEGRHIRLIVEHPILSEDMPRSLSEAETHFGAVEFTLDKENKGEGFVFGRVTIAINEDGTIGFKPLASVKQMLTFVRKH